MSSKKAATTSISAKEAREPLFTVESANEALILVRKVVGDVVERYGELMRLRMEAQELSLESGAQARFDEISLLVEQTLERLKTLHQELIDVGCELKDFATGLVDFPAEIDGRKVWLCWKLREAEVSHWHELDAGFTGRQPIDAEFRASLGKD